MLVRLAVFYYLCATENKTCNMHIIQLTAENEKSATFAVYLAIRPQFYFVRKQRKASRQANRGVYAKEPKRHTFLPTSGTRAG